MDKDETEMELVVAKEGKSRRGGKGTSWFSVAVQHTPFGIASGTRQHQDTAEYAGLRKNGSRHHVGRERGLTHVCDRSGLAMEFFLANCHRQVFGGTGSRNY